MSCSVSSSMDCVSEPRESNMFCIVSVCISICVVCLPIFTSSCPSVAKKSPTTISLCATISLCSSSCCGTCVTRSISLCSSSCCARSCFVVGPASVTGVKMGRQTTQMERQTTQMEMQNILDSLGSDTQSIEEETLQDIGRSVQEDTDFGKTLVYCAATGFVVWWLLCKNKTPVPATPAPTPVPTPVPKVAAPTTPAPTRLSWVKKKPDPFKMN